MAEDAASIALIGDMLAQAAKSKALYVVARLGLVDKLLPVGEVIKTTEQLEEELEVVPGNLDRILRLAGQIGLVKEHEGGRWSATQLSSVLAEDHPSQFKYMAITWNMPLHRNSMAWAYESIKEGKAGFKYAYGEQHKDVWGLMFGDAEELQVFEKALTGVTKLGEAVVLSLEWSKYKVVADVGGNTGALLSTVLKHHAHVKGFNFDVPQVINGLPPVPAELEGRLVHVAGSFFEAPVTSFSPELKGLDLVILKHVLHDWNDADNATILGNVVGALAPDGEIIVIDHLVPDTVGKEPGSLPLLPFWIDLVMLGMTPGGRERTLAQWANLFEKAGLAPPEVLTVVGGLAAIRTRRAA